MPPIGSQSAGRVTSAVILKYTLDGVNVTADVVSGAIPEDVIVQSDIPDEENQDEQEQDTGDAEKEELQFEEPETEVTDPELEETELPEDDENNDYAFLQTAYHGSLYS